MKNEMVLASVGVLEKAQKLSDSEIDLSSADFDADDIPDAPENLSVEQLLVVIKRLHRETKLRIRQTLKYAIKTGEFLKALKKKYRAQGQMGKGWERFVEDNLGITVQYADRLIVLYRGWCTDPKIAEEMTITNAHQRAKELLAPQKPDEESGKESGKEGVPVEAKAYQNDTTSEPRGSEAAAQPAPTDAPQLAAPASSTIAPATATALPDAQPAPTAPSTAVSTTACETIVYEAPGVRAVITVSAGAAIDIKKFVDGLWAKLAGWE